MSSDIPVILEVAVNGVTTKERNPEVPDSPEAIAADALRCLDEGAAIIHMHTTVGGRPTAEAAAEYAEAFRLIRAERDDGILYPTMGGGAGIHDRRHSRVLGAAHPRRARALPRHARRRTAAVGCGRAGRVATRLTRGPHGRGAGRPPARRPRGLRRRAEQRRPGARCRRPLSIRGAAGGDAL